MATTILNWTDKLSVIAATALVLANKVPGTSDLRFKFGALLPMRLVLALLLFASHASADHAASPLADAVEKQDHARIQSLLKKGADVNAAQVDGMTALHWAAQYDDLA